MMASRLGRMSEGGFFGRGEGGVALGRQKTKKRKKKGKKSPWVLQLQLPIKSLKDSRNQSLVHLLYHGPRC